MTDDSKWGTGKHERGFTYKVGDLVYLKSPDYRVKQCLAEIYQVGQCTQGYEFTIKDNTTFEHGHFDELGRHYMESSDRIKPYKIDHFDKGLFTL